MRGRVRAEVRARGPGAVAAALLLGGCAELAYYGQAFEGQVELLAARRPVAELATAPATPAALRARLERAQAMRRFAVAALALPDNGSYQSFAALGRPHAVWLVVATPPLSLDAREWCFPIAGCVNYRGYFDAAAAQAFAAGRRAAGDDVMVAGVPAYSTLGWFDDPLLDTFIELPEGRLAELMFHELAHQRVYVAGDPAFNEAYATAVGRLGARAWLAAQGAPGAVADYAQALARQQQFVERVLATRETLAALYASAVDDAARRAGKARAFAALRADYARLRADWGGYAGYDHWFGQDLNNARLVGVTTYHRLAPAFEEIHRLLGGDFAALHRAVEALAALPPAARDAYLAALLARLDSQPAGAPAAPPAPGGPPQSRAARAR